MEALHHPVISAAVEGVIDEVVLRRVAEYTGVAIGTVYGRTGKGKLLKQLNGYNQAARHAPWIVLVDLDRDDACAPAFCHVHLPHPAPYMNFRVAVRETEAWLLADRERIAPFLRVSARHVPSDPESLDDPKRTLVDLAARSPSREIRDAIAPRPGSGRQVGPAYTSRVMEFVQSHWRPDVALTHSDSLQRCVDALRRLKETEP